MENNDLYFDYTQNEAYRTKFNQMLETMGVINSKLDQQAANTELDTIYKQHLKDAKSVFPEHVSLMKRLNRSMENNAKESENVFARGGWKLLSAGVDSMAKTLDNLTDIPVLKQLKTTGKFVRDVVNEQKNRDLNTVREAYAANQTNNTITDKSDKPIKATDHGNTPSFDNAKDNYQAAPVDHGQDKHFKLIDGHLIQIAEDVKILREHAQLRTLLTVAGFMMKPVLAILGKMLGGLVGLGKMLGGLVGRKATSEKVKKAIKKIKPTKPNSKSKPNPAKDKTSDTNVDKTKSKSTPAPKPVKEKSFFEKVKTIFGDDKNDKKSTTTKPVKSTGRKAIKAVGTMAISRLAVAGLVGASAIAASPAFITMAALYGAYEVAEAFGLPSVVAEKFEEFNKKRPSQQQSTFSDYSNIRAAAAAAPDHERIEKAAKQQQQQQQQQQRQQRDNDSSSNVVINNNSNTTNNSTIRRGNGFNFGSNRDYHRGYGYIQR